MLLFQFMIVIPTRGLVAKVEIASSPSCFLAKARTGTPRNDTNLISSSLRGPTLFCFAKAKQRGAVAISTPPSVVWQQTRKQESSLVFPAKGGPPTYRTTYSTIGIIPFIKINGALHHQYVCLGMVNMSFPRRRESRFPSGHYANGKSCRAQKFIMIGITRILTNSHPALQQKKEAGQKPASLPTKKFIGFGVCLFATTQQQSAKSKQYH